MSAAENLISQAAMDAILGSTFGRTVDINLLGTKAKICSFDCAYCNLGATEVRLNKLKNAGILPSIQEIADSTSALFREIHEHGPMVDTILVSGNGEATLHPDFPELVKILRELRDQWLPKKPIALLTNGSNLDQRRISESVNLFDHRFVKVDAGNERVFKLMNTPLARVNLQKVLGGIRLLKDVSIQAMFCKGAIDNTGNADIDDWIEVMGLLKPKAIHIQSLTRAPHAAGLIRCDEDTLHTIASKLERRTGLKAIVLP